MGGWAGIPLPFFVAEYMAVEFTNHAFLSMLMCGYTRKKIFQAKLIVCMMGLFGFTLINTIAGTAVATILNGFGAELNGMTISYMAKRFIYSVLLFTVCQGMFCFLFAVITKRKTATILIRLVGYQLIASTTGRIWYILNDMKNPVWREIVHGIFEITPLYQIDSLLVPDHFKTHQFWQYLLSCSVCLIMTYLLTINIFKKCDMQ